MRQQSANIKIQGSQPRAATIMVSSPEAKASGDFGIKN